MKMNVICLMQLGEYPVVTNSYDHEFLKSNSVPTFHKIMLWKITEIPKKARVSNNYGLIPYDNGVVMIKKPSAPILTTQTDF